MAATVVTKVASTPEALMPVSHACRAVHASARIAAYAAALLMRQVGQSESAR